MSNTSKITIAILGFIICAIIGFMGMKSLSRIKDSHNRGTTISSMQTGMTSGSGKTKPRAPGNTAATIPEPSYGETAVPSSASSSQEDLTDISSSSQPSPGVLQTRNSTLGAGLASIPEILEVSTPRYDDVGKTYSFQVVASGENLTYTVADAKKKDIQSNGTGDFRVPPSSTGKYYVYITDRYGNKTDYTEVKGCYRLVNRVTKEELQLILNTGKSQDAIDADFSNRISSGCRYDFVGIDDDEIPPGSYNEIINRVRMRTWSSVTVLSVVHNSETNKLVRARIQVNY